MITRSAAVLLAAATFSAGATGLAVAEKPSPTGTASSSLVAKKQQDGAAKKKARPAPRAARRALAKSLGITMKELRAELKKGTTPKALIEQKGKNADTVRAAVRDAARKVLERRVERGKMTAAQADKRAARIAVRFTGDRPLTKKRGAKAQRARS